MGAVEVERAWALWDERPGDRGTAVALDAETTRHAETIGATLNTCRALMAAGRRAGQSRAEALAALPAAVDVLAAFRSVGWWWPNPGSAR